MKTRPRYLPLIEAEVGMLLDAPVRLVNSGFLTFSLPAGHTLTQDNLNQLVAHRAEFIYVAEPDSRPDAQVAADAAHDAHRVMEIFAGADLSDPNIMALFDQG